MKIPEITQIFYIPWLSVVIGLFKKLSALSQRQGAKTQSFWDPEPCFLCLTLRLIPFPMPYAFIPYITT